MIAEKSIDEFRNSGLLFLANSLLHAFGWSLVAEGPGDGQPFTRLYPARVKFRGFDDKTSENGYINISKFMVENAPALLEEAQS